MGTDTRAHAQVGQAGRLLGSNGFQCHGTNGKEPGIDGINGKSVGEIYMKVKRSSACRPTLPTS